MCAHLKCRMEGLMATISANGSRKYPRQSFFCLKYQKVKPKTIVIRKKVVILQHRTTTSMNTSKKKRL